MGNSASSPTVDTTTIVNNNEQDNSLTCPVTGRSSSSMPTNHPMMNNNNNTNNMNHMNNMDAAAAMGCPVAGSSKKPNTTNNDSSSSSSSYNVYGQKIDPTNHMPVVPNQQPYPDQKKSLDTERIQSKIRKGGTDSTWIYPSEQMFYNALKRKNKAEGITEEDMEVLLKIHNGTNERAWKLVMEWENALHQCECKDPTLQRFLGKPADLAPKAWIKSTLMGYPKPFDRHDWIVDRCGKEVRYVLDFYYDEKMLEGDNLTLAKNEDGFLVPRHVVIDARPALDNFENLVDRVKFLFKPKADL